MIKFAGIIFFIVCICGIIGCLYIIPKAYSSLKENEESLAELIEQGEPKEGYSPMEGVWISKDEAVYNYYEWIEDSRKSVKENKQEIVLCAFFLISLLSGIYYLASTKFGSAKLNAIENIDLETKIIKMQIEKKELLAKLEDIEKNG